jgi:hypothetical protein
LVRRQRLPAHVDLSQSRRVQLREPGVCLEIPQPFRAGLTFGGQPAGH